LAAASASVAQVHLRAGRFAECAETAERALELDPTLTQARYALATSLLRLGRTDQGRLELEKYERQQADATAARSRKLKLDGLKREVALSTAKGNRENVVRLLREALDYERNVAAAHYTLGVALLETGQPAEAVERFKSAELLDDHFDVHRRLAEAYAALGQLEQSGREQAVYERMKRDSLRQAGTNR
jgi:tetratricopeptide (TPR) repeat protein